MRLTSKQIKKIVSVPFAFFTVWFLSYYFYDGMSVIDSLDKIINSEYQIFTVFLFVLIVMLDSFEENRKN